MYEQKKYNPLYILELSKKLRQTQTEAEEILWEILKNRKFNNIKFRRQHPIGRYIAGFYSDELQLVIELDGKIHENQKEYDEIRNEFINSSGISVLRFSNETVFENISEILNSIIPFIPSTFGRGQEGEGFSEAIGVQEKDLKGSLKAPFPIVALTATATPKVRTDIVERLGLKEYQMFTAGFDRKNLAFIVREISKEQEKLEKVAEIISKTPPFGIIYCSSVKNVSKVYQYLLQNGVRVGIYNGEMSGELREKEQNNFMNGTYDVIVATNAFGMGIDKKDIRYVIHYNLPGSIENYYQEVGRAGRDGKNSYGIILASYQDTIIQEFFIENSYPPKDDILSLYDYFYKDFKLGEGSGTQILKTYNSIAIESGIKSDMKVGSIIKIFEKYGVVKRGFDAREGEVDFRGRGITLISPKTHHDKIPVLWAHQDLLKQESYFKLEQVKKLLFRPGCRKKFILEYFGDEEDLKNLKDNCGVCDYCIDKKKYDNSQKEFIVPTNIFFIILEFIKRLDNKFGSQILAGILTGSKEAKIIEWNLDIDKDFNILGVYSRDLVVAFFEVLIDFGYIYKTSGQYPKLSISQTGIAAIYNNSILIDEEKEIQSTLFFKARSMKKSVETKNFLSLQKSGVQKVKIEKIDTYTQTLELLKEKLSLDEIAEKRGLGVRTIEEHLVNLYIFNKLTLSEILKYSTLDKLKKVKEVIKDNSLTKDKLKPIKEMLGDNITYFDIKIALSMIDKGDL